MSARIIELAKQCGYWSGQTIEMNDEGIKKFYHLVYESVFRDANYAASRTILDAAILEEREQCARLAEKFHHDQSGCLEEIAAAIRQRSNNERTNQRTYGGGRLRSTRDCRSCS